MLGTYNPQAHKREEELKLKIDRIDHWLGVGAQPTDTAKSLIRQGRMSPEEWLERAEKLSQAKLQRKSKKQSCSIYGRKCGLKNKKNLRKKHLQRRGGRNAR